MADLILKGARDPNVVYTSGPLDVPENVSSVLIDIGDYDIINEPSTTHIYLLIERSLDGGNTWGHLVSASYTGFDGVTPPRPIGGIKFTTAELIGHKVRGTFYFEAADTKKQQIGLTATIT